MNIRSDLRAGMTYTECDQIRNYWKQMAQSGNCSYTPQPPATGTTPPPTTTYPPTTSGQANCCGGYAGGKYYPDYSGYCA